MDIEDKILKTFQKIIAQGKLGHSYLIVGDDNDVLNGFTTKFLAQCVADKFSSDNLYSYPYLAEVKAKSVSRIISVDQTREFEKHFQIKGEKGWRRIGIIWDADRMNEQAQNAFLKTLEEPTDGSLIILVTSTPKGILPTVRSRCQLISLRTGKKYHQLHRYDEIVTVLKELKPSSGAEKSLTAANVVKDIFSQIGEIASQKVTLIEADPNESKVEKKDREATNKALLKSEYLRIREDYIGLLFTWFSQLVLLANGVKTSSLDHGYFFEQGAPEWLNELDSNAAEYQLECCQEFCKNLNYNVKEELLIDDFFLKVVEKI